MFEEAYELNYSQEKTHWWFVARREILQSIIYSLIESSYLSPPLKILDYGCGTGALTQMLDEFGEVTGVDESDAAVQFCKLRGMQNVPKINSSKELPCSTFDLVTCFDVMEHLTNDEELIGELHRTLKSNGVLLLTVPALNILWSGEDIISKHVRRYRKHELIQKIERKNFEVIKASYFNLFLFPLIFSIRIFNRHIRPASLLKSDVYSVPTFVNNTLKNIFSTERFILKHTNLPIGVSLLLAARKIPSPHNRLDTQTEPLILQT